MKTTSKSILKQSMHLIKQDLWRYVAIFVVAEAMALLLMHQISSRVFQLALISAKIKGINNQNFWEVLTSPPALLLILLTLLLLASFVIFQMSLLMGFADRPYHGQKISFKNLFKPVLRKIKPTHFFILILYIFIIMPLGNLGLTSALTSSLRIPDFILDVIFATPWMSVVYYLSIIVLFYLNIRFFFAFIIFYNEDRSFLAAMRASWAMTRSHTWLIFKITTRITLYTLAIMLVILFITMGPLFFIETYFPRYLRIANSLLSTLFLFLTMMLVSISSIALVQSIVVSYHWIVDPSVVPYDDSYTPRRTHWFLNISGIIIYTLFALVVYFDKPNPDLLGQVFIVSHRGESVRAIENTLDSLIIANASKPDYVEMDIQQLNDGTLVVFHDTDLKRLAGVNRKITSYSWEDLNQEVVLSSHGITSTIPTLDAYLSLAHELDQDLMIEIKTNATDDARFLETLHDLVVKHDMVDKVIYQSLDKKAILEYKELFPDSTVGYILGLNIGGLENLNVDFFSLEDFSLSTRVVREAQRMRKGLFVWTVNDESLMQTYYKTNISGIITDDVEMANRVRESMRSNPISDLFWNFGINFD